MQLKNRTKKYINIKCVTQWHSVTAFIVKSKFVRYNTHKYMHLTYLSGLWLMGLYQNWHSLAVMSSTRPQTYCQMYLCSPCACSKLVKEYAFLYILNCILLYLLVMFSRYKSCLITRFRLRPVFSACLTLKTCNSIMYVNGLLPWI